MRPEIATAISPVEREGSTVVAAFPAQTPRILNPPFRANTPTLRDGVRESPPFSRAIIYLNEHGLDAISVLSKDKHHDRKP